MANKITKAQMLTMIKAVDGVATNPDMVAFIDHEIELLEKKSANKKPTKAQAENESVKAEILEVLTHEGATVTDIQKKSEVLGELSNQRVSALLRQLVEVGKVVKTVDKKKSFFSLASDAEQSDLVVGVGASKPTPMRQGAIE